MPEGERRALAYSSAIAGWASVDPKAAAAWTLENLSGIYRRTAVARIGKVWAYTQPSEAAEWAIKYASEIDQVFSLTEVLEVWADSYGLDAVEWCTKLPAGKLHDLALSKAIFTWADYFPQTAAEWLLKHPDDLWLLPRAAARWGQHSPADASAWLDKNVSEATAQECREAMVMELWLKDQKSGIEKDIGIEQAAVILMSSSPAAVLNEVLNMQSPERRQRTLTQHYQDWKLNEPLAAEAWLKQHPEAVKIMTP